MKNTTIAGFTLALASLCACVSQAAPEPTTAAPHEIGSLLVEQRGTTGPAVILIPGLAGGSWLWDDTVRRLKTTHRLYLLTLPGFDGRKPQPEVTLDIVQQDLLMLIDHQHIARPVLVGHSLGGTLSLAFAAQHSDRIAGVIAIDGLPVFPGTESITGDRSALAQGARAQISGLTPQQFADYQLNYAKQIGVIDEALAAKVAALNGRSDVGATADFAAQILALDLRPKLAAIKVPVVEISPFNAPDFARMGVDEMAKTNYYRALLAGVDQLEVLSISPARHFVMLDQPATFATALDAALAKMAPPK